jgi:hypothetical protein
MPVYQTTDKKLVSLLRGLGFKYNYKNNIWEFEYTKELGQVLEDLKRK